MSNKTVAKWIISIAIFIMSYIIIMLVILHFDTLRVHAETPMRSEIQAAYQRFRATALSENLPLTEYSYGHEYIIQVSDYYQVYTDQNETAAIILCDVTFDKKTYTIKFSTINDYYAGLNTLLAKLKYAKMTTPECFEGLGRPADTTDESLHYDEPYGVAIDEDEDGIIDYWTAPDGKTAYPPEQFVEEYDFQIYVVQHLDLYVGLVDIDTSGEVYWRADGRYIGYPEGYEDGGQGVDIDPFDYDQDADIETADTKKDDKDDKKEDKKGDK